MIFHEYTGLYAEVSPPQKIGGGGAQNAAVVLYRNAHEALRMIHIYRKEYIRSIPIIPEHDRDENCRRENIVITCEYPGSYSEVTPPQNSGAVLQVQQYRSVRGTPERAGIAAD